MTKRGVFMKKTIKDLGIAVLAAMLVFAFAGCKEPEDDPPPPPPPSVINIADIQGVTVPVKDGIPVTTITENEQYSGTVTWTPDISETFANSTAYTATITLTAKSGFTLQGVAANFFTVAIATSVSNDTNSGVVTAVFPSTDAHVINIAAIQGVTAPVNGGTPVTEITENEQYSGTVTWDNNPSIFAALTVYTATITLTPKTNYSLQGVSADFFTIEGATSISNAADSGIITVIFPATKATVINIAAIQGVAVPVNGGTPVTEITENEQYSGVVTWNNGNPSTFAASTIYSATITLTPKTGYTLQGVHTNFFTVAGAIISVTNSANSGVITAVFPATAATVINISAIEGVTVPANGGTPVRVITENLQYSGTVTWNGNPSVFSASTSYTATITLTAKSGYTLQGVSANFFIVVGATSVSNSTNSGVITAVFPATGIKTVNSFKIKTQPTKLTYTHGDQLDLTGLVVTLIYNDISTENVAAKDFTDKSITTNPANDHNLVHLTHNNKPVTIAYNNLDSLATSNLTVSPKVITFSIDAIQPQPYTGYPIQPTITVKDGTATLALNSDYIVSYVNNTNAGTATANITGTGNYVGSSGSAMFTINATPTAADFNINGTGTFTYDGNTKIVTITPKAGKSTGAITVKYNGSSEPIPLAVGTYNVTFDVAVITGFSATSGLSAGTLKIINATPTTDDFNINGKGTFTYDGSSKSVTITPKAGKSTGAITVKYNGNSEPEPLAVGTYNITFDVAAATNFNAANGLSAGTQKIINATPTASDFNISGIGTFTYDGNPKKVTITSKAGKTTGAITVKYGNSIKEPSATGIYPVTFDVAAATNFDTVSGLCAGTLIILKANPLDNDFYINGIGSFYYDGSPKIVTITPKNGKSNGDITVKYNGSTSLPLAVGIYNVTFDVAAEANYNAVTGLFVDIITINPFTSIADLKTYLENKPNNNADYHYYVALNVNDISTLGQMLRDFQDKGKDLFTDIDLSGSTFTNIVNDTFSCCYNLTSVTLPNSLTSIGDRAFFDCANLTSVTLPNSLTSIGDSAFSCTNLTSVTLPNSLTSIGNCAFIGSRLRSVTIGNSVTTIGESAFQNCQELSSVTIGNSVTTIGERAFQLCVELRKINIPNSVTSIGKMAFDATGITSINIPSSVTNIEVGISQSPSLTAVNVDGDNKNYSSDQGVLYNKNKTSLIYYPTGKGGFFSIPDSVTSIGKQAITSRLTGITIPNSVTSIEEYAFYKCSNLTNVTFQGTINSENFNIKAFQDTGDLREKYLAYGIGTYIRTSGSSYWSLTPDVTPTAADFNISGIGTFTYDGSPKTVTITPKTGKSTGAITIKYNGRTTAPSAVGEYSVTFDVAAVTGFNAVNGLSAGTLMINTTPTAEDFNISGIGTFAYDNNPWSVNIEPKTGKSTGAITVKYNGSTTAPSAVGEYSVTFDVAASTCFYAVKGLSAGTLTIRTPPTFTNIDALKIYLQDLPVNTRSRPYIVLLNVNDLTSIKNALKAANVEKKYVSIDFSGSTFTNIVNDTFSYCYNLTSVTLPNSLTSIENKAFYGCSRLTVINVNSNNNAFTSENGVLYNKYKTTLFIYPEGKTDSSFTIPNGVTKIDSYAFFKCTSLNSVTIPNSVTSIGVGAFENCTYLTSVTIPDSVTIIENGTFKNCSYLIITMSKNVTSIGKEAFKNCGTIKNIVSVTIPNNVITIEEEAFYGCTNIASVTLPNSLTSIGNKAFYGCKNLTSVTIPDSVISIGNWAFSRCTNLTVINVNSNNNAFTSENGVLYNKYKTTLFIYPEGKTDSSFTIPNGVTKIDSYAFFECTSLNSVTIPNSVTSIGVGAFENCTYLTSVTFYTGSTITSTNFGNGAFPEGIYGNGGENLRTAYLKGGTGTYKRASEGTVWIKQ